MACSAHELPDVLWPWMHVGAAVSLSLRRTDGVLDARPRAARPPAVSVSSWSPPPCPPTHKASTGQGWTFSEPTVARQYPDCSTSSATSAAVPLHTAPSGHSTTTPPTMTWPGLATHRSMLPAPGRSVISPSAQGVQSEALLAASLVLYVPMAHGMHWANPPSSAYMPATHAVQLKPVPGAADAVPGAQGEHLLAPATLKLPAWHA